MFYCRLPQASHLIRIATLLLIAVSIGCGKEGNRVSGKITFKDQPVPAGKIYFMPDTAKGNSGAAGYADIVNGVYDTKIEGGKGVISGPMVVAIEGIDPKPPASASGEGAEDVTSTILFARYETQLDLADGESTHDIEVPAEAAKMPPQMPEGAFLNP